MGQFHAAGRYSRPFGAFSSLASLSYFSMFSRKRLKHNHFSQKPFLNRLETLVQISFFQSLLYPEIQFLIQIHVTFKLHKL